VKLTARALNRATLERQLLLRRESLTAVDAVNRIVALQAQAPASPYLALWNRLRDFDPADLATAFDDRTLVKTTLMRITMHAVGAEDYRPFRAAIEPTLRASRLGDERFRASGLSAADADELIPGLLKYAKRVRTSVEIDDWLTRKLGQPLPTASARLLRQYVPWWHAPAGEPWTFGPRTSYVNPTVPRGRHTPESGLKSLIPRYLAGFGPATIADIGQFAMIPRARVRAAVQQLSDELQQFDGPDKQQLYDVPGGRLPAEDAPAPPRLLPMWDSVLLAYSDRSRVIAAEHRKQVIRMNGDVLPTVLVDGYVAGVWRAVDGGIEITSFRPLSKGIWSELAAEAQALGRFLADRDPAVYGRYNHWWDKRTWTATDVKLLPG
jgi:hypothetical protein